MGNFFEDAVSFATDPFGAGAAFTNVLGDSPIGGILGIKQNQMAAEQFKEQMKWENFKFNNAHQAEIADLKAAGINPVLTASGGTGASAGSLTPTASASSGNFGALMSLLSTIIPAISSLKQANAANKLADANANKLTAEAGKIAADTDLSNLEYLLKHKDYLNYDTKFNYEKSRTPLWFVEQIEKMFNAGTNSAAAKELENKEFNILWNMEKAGDKIKPIENLSPNGIMRMFIKAILGTLIKK